MTAYNATINVLANSIWQLALFRLQQAKRIFNSVRWSTVASTRALLALSECFSIQFTTYVKVPKVRNLQEDFIEGINGINAVQKLRHQEQAQSGSPG
jgi:hypothetical protein